MRAVRYRIAFPNPSDGGTAMSRRPPARMFAMPSSRPSHTPGGRTPRVKVSAVVACVVVSRVAPARAAVIEHHPRVRDAVAPVTRGVHEMGVVLIALIEARPAPVERDLRRRVIGVCATGCLAVTKVVTFGAPKLGPRETRDAAEPLDILRVVQKDDLIPLLPMSRPFVRKPYVHLGEGVVLDNDAPGRYARLSKEWGTAGILWKQRRHTGYARGANDERPSAAIEANGVAGDPLVAARPSPERAEGAEETEGASAFVSADEPDELEALSASDERARRGRFHAARERLRRLRAALGEGIARRRAAFAAASGAGAEADARAGPARDAGAGEVPASVPASDSASVPASVTDDEGARAFAREVAAWASSDAEASDERPSSVAASSDESSADESSADASAAEGRRSGSSRWSLFKRARSADPAPFDDVEGELFVRVAETTPFGGASDVAAAAADEWERAAAATETGPPRRKSVSAGGDPRAGPTIFEELWKLRGLDAEARGNRLESHRMRRYVEEIQRAIDAGPVQTSLAGVYAGKEGDEVGLDFSDDAFAGDGEDGAVEGGVASWMTWSR